MCASNHEPRRLQESKQDYSSVSANVTSSTLPALEIEEYGGVQECQARLGRWLKARSNINGCISSTRTDTANTLVAS